MTPIPAASSAPVKFEPVEYYSTPAERAKIKSAGLKMNLVVQSQCFADFMAKQDLKWTNKRTPYQVVTHLQGIRGTVPVEMYSRCLGMWPCTRAVAYRNPGSLTIHLNRNAFYPGMSDCQWAATMAHESVTHALGEYDHDFNWTRAREDSVSYVVGGRKAQYGGDAFDKCCQ